MSVAGWSLLIGVLLLGFVLLGRWLARLPLSAAVLYLAVGMLLGPLGLGLVAPDPVRDAALLLSVTEVALLVSLFSVGLQLGVPLRNRRWWLPTRLAVVSMTLMVGLVAAVGVWLLALPLGAAIVLGAIVAPTDPVLATDIHAEPGPRPDALGFSLAGEGGLNDGTAFPFVMLGLGLLGLHTLGEHGLRWWTIDLLWATVGGLGIGGALGTLTGLLVLQMRSRLRETVGLDVFLGLGLIAATYGAAQFAQASGFLAVLACGLALQRVRERPMRYDAASRAGAPLDEAAVGGHAGQASDLSAPHPAAGKATLREAVQLFNGQIEKLIELAIVLLIGAMLAYTRPMPVLWWFIPLLLLVLRPLSVLPSLLGARVSRQQAVLIAWFGIRGVGSVYYLAFVLQQGVTGEVADLLVTLTLWTVAASILTHGLTARPLMRLYLAQRS